MGFHFENLLRGLGGLFFLIFICYVFSSNRRAINWRVVAIGVAAQIGFGICVLSGGKYNFFRIVMESLSTMFVRLKPFGN